MTKLESQYNHKTTQIAKGAVVQLGTKCHGLRILKLFGLIIELRHMQVIFMVCLISEKSHTFIGIC